MSDEERVRLVLDWASRNGFKILSVEEMWERLDEQRSTGVRAQLTNDQRTELEAMILKWGLS